MQDTRGKTIGKEKRSSRKRGIYTQMTGEESSQKPKVSSTLRTAESKSSLVKISVDDRTKCR
jgi:hypothetical protein